jgi:hypothetical protein
VVVDDKDGGNFMATVTFNVSNDGQLQGGGKWQGQRGRRRHINQIEEEASAGCPPTCSDTRSFGGGAFARCLQWCYSGAIGVQHCQGGNGGASVGSRRQRIVVGGALAAPSDVRGIGCVLEAACQWEYGGGVFGVTGGGGASMGWQWHVGYVGASVALTAAGWEELNNQLDCDGSGSKKAASTS